MPLFSPAALQVYADQAARTAQPTPAPADARAVGGLGAAPYLAMAAGTLADGASTWFDLHKGYGHEADPLYPDNGAAVFALRAAELVPQALTMKYLADHGHPQLARLFGYGAGAMGAYFAAHNLNVARQAQP
jgi:hypothetical protein